MIVSSVAFSAGVLLDDFFANSASASCDSRTVAAEAVEAAGRSTARRDMMRRLSAVASAVFWIVVIGLVMVCVCRVFK